METWRSRPKILLALGASGALCGTGFFTSEESLASDNAKQAALHGTGDDTERGSVFDIARGLDWPTNWSIRALRNNFTRRWSEDIQGLRQNLSEEQARYETAQAADDTNIAAVIVGEGNDLIQAIQPAHDTLHRIISQAEDHLRRINRLVERDSKG